MNGGLYHLLRSNIKMKIWKTQINSKNINQNILSLKTNDGIWTTPISKGTKTDIFFEGDKIFGYGPPQYRRGLKLS